MSDDKKWVKGWWFPFFPLQIRTAPWEKTSDDPIRVNAKKVIKRLTDANWDVPGVEDWTWALENIIVEAFQDGTEEKEEDSRQ